MTQPVPIRRYEAFTTTANPITNKSKLWRYLTFEKFVSMMESAAIYHARLDQMEDKFEGSVTKLYTKRRATEQHFGYMDFPGLEPVNNRRLRYSSFVTCWYASDVESAAMWKLYSRVHGGVAIVTTVERMEQSIELPTEAAHGLFGPVEYIDFETSDMTLPHGYTARPGFTKQKSFDHEREVRGMIRINRYPEDPNLLLTAENVESLKTKMPFGVSAAVNLIGLVENIYVSPLSPRWIIDIVESAAKRAGLGNVVLLSKMLGEPIY